MRFPTRSELYYFVRGIARHEDQDIGKPVVRQPGVAKAIIPAAYVSGNPKIQQWHESSTTLGTKIYKTVQAYGNRNAAPAASDSIAVGSDPDGNKEILGKLVNVGSAVVDADYVMGLRPVAPGNTLLLTLNAEQSTNSTSYLTVKRVYVTRPGKYRIKGELSRTGGTTSAQVGLEFPDGTIVVASSAATYNGTVYPTFGSQFSLDMTVSVPWGSFLVIQLQNDSGPAQTAYIRTVTVCYADATASLGSYDSVLTD
jgi:hypothetical protein